VPFLQFTEIKKAIGGMKITIARSSIVLLCDLLDLASWGNGDQFPHSPTESRTAIATCQMDMLRPGKQLSSHSLQKDAIRKEKSHRRNLFSNGKGWILFDQLANCS
jgi:hypothetical protein